MPALPPYDGAGSAEVSTLRLGADATGGTEPVMSLDACGLLAHGLSPNRAKSALQPANPAASAAIKARRDTVRERDGSTKLDMRTLTRTQRTGELNTEPVNRALSLTAPQP